MIDTHALFDEIKNNLALVCPDGQDDSDLVHIANIIIDKNIPIVSSSPADIEILWTWLEKAKTQIFARFFLDKNSTEISNLAEKISTDRKSTRLNSSH